MNSLDIQDMDIQDMEIDIMDEKADTDENMDVDE